MTENRTCAGCRQPIKADAEGRWTDSFWSDPIGFICDTPAPGAGLTHQPKEDPMTKPTLAQQYGETFARQHEAHYAAVAVVREFSDRHPLTIPNPAYPPHQPGRPYFTIPNPVKHTLHRDGDTLSCVECGESVHAPSPPKRPLTPMEASLSPFD